MAMLDGFKVFKRVTAQLFKLKPGDEIFFLCDGPMHVGEKIGDKEPATLMNVTNLETGEEGQIICGAVFQKELSRAYENNAYVGKKFWLKVTRIPEKKYNTYEIAEISETEEAPVSDKKAKK